MERHANDESKPGLFVSGSGAAASEGGMAAGERGVVVRGGVHGPVQTGASATYIASQTVVQAAVQRSWKRSAESDPLRRWENSVGRVAELDALRARLSPEDAGSRSVAVSGMAGMGKSTIASLYVHQYGRMYPGGVLWADLGYAFRQAELCQPILRRWAQCAYAGDVQLPQGRQFDPLEVKSLLAGHGAMLVVLDDIWDLDAIRPLRTALPDEAGVLVTTRDQRIAREFGDLALPSLSRDDALALLHSDLSDVRDELLGALAEGLGYHAQALSIAAADLALRMGTERRERSIRQLLERVERGTGFGDLPGLEARDGQSAVEVALEASYEALGAALGPEYQKRFRALGLLGASETSFRRNAVAALWNDDDDATADFLEELRARSLLRSADETGDRWTQHRLVRTYARALFHREEEPSERRATLERIVGWYQETVWLLSSLLDPAVRREEAQKQAASISPAIKKAVEEAGEEAVDVAVDVILLEILEMGDAERVNVLALLRECAEEEFWDLIPYMALGLSTYFDIRSLWSDWEETAELAVRAARESGVASAVSLSMSNMGDAYQARARWQEAIQCYLESLTICQALGDRGIEAKVLTSLGIVYTQQGRWQEAIQCYEESLDISRALGSGRGEGSILMNLGVIYQRAGRWEEAAAHFEETLDTCRAAGDRHAEGMALFNLGNVYQEQGRFADAVQCYQQSLVISRTMGDRHGEAGALNGLGALYQRLGWWEDSILCFEESLGIKRDLGDGAGEGETLGNLGNVMHAQGRWEEAVAYYQRALLHFQALGDRYAEGQILMNLGHAYQDEDRLEEAIRYYLDSIAVWKAMGNRRGEGMILTNLGSAYGDTDQEEEAIQSYQQALDIWRESGDREGAARVLGNLGFLYQSLERWNEAIGCYRESLEIVRTLGNPHREGMILTNLGMVHAELGQPEETVTCWLEALQRLQPDSEQHHFITSQLEGVRKPGRQGSRWSRWFRS